VSKADFEAWESRYSTGTYEGRAWPSDLLETWINRMPAGRALDVPCGQGRNALYLAANGWQVDGVDISPSALDAAARRADEQGVTVNWHAADLDEGDAPNPPYDLIVSCFFMDRGLIPRMKEWLSPDGFVVFEQHMATPLKVDGPGSPQWRLAPNELLTLFSDFRTLQYEEGIFRHERSGRTVTNALSRLVACKGAPGF
jgi:tellurite methyltransferase